jgi:peptidoglycan hydrolase-like protein with peptidoglycan-binding domain
VRAVKNDVTFDSAMDNPSTMKNRLTRAKNDVMDKKSTMMDGSDKTTGSQTHVAAAQQALKTNGYNPGPIDGYAGPQTTTAVREFQQREQLQVTGQLDPETLGRLGVGIGGAARTPQTR